MHAVCSVMCAMYALCCALCATSVVHFCKFVIFPEEERKG